MEAPIYTAHPVGGIDYPRTMQEFDEWFPDEARLCQIFVSAALAKWIYLPFINSLQLVNKIEGVDRKNCNESEVDTPFV